jgi:hypothetical protein
MTVWTLLEWLAWALSAGIALWIFADLVRVSRAYDEEYLTTGVEEFDDSTHVESAGGR